MLVKLTPGLKLIDYFLEDFNKRIMTPELNEDEMRLLHKEAMELYDLYFKPDAKHKIGVGEHIAKEIFSSNKKQILISSCFLNPRS